ncbi:uncharacterized protein Z518_07506 [Rhinocladiella mackenziei CBS 650.93]|uniref:Rhinocladiella mackenziei CBS 650.93 unplaced genomic scaffold supercont1.5, whole genome shotgun sequence n=1 Tax=Rhinocladiella mackenziei CBS 650.93 TaxID=1442369 RepID=A0A0D2H0L2_9EURO|nr:uncharacterized protein Z518_07506 [Rhinocladiella mackenziei CBS 650.93]KIX03953.1 hypothetical protein Z518_07506 [Rhinocladiella mackenziei CBS 650.93]
MSMISSATLRTKTGCLTCRARRKKCNEQRPRCEKCVKSKRTCSWPAEDDLFDRRHRRPSRPPKSPSRSPETIVIQRSPPLASELLAETDAWPFFICRELSINSDLFSGTIFKSDLEMDCFRQFVNGFLPLLILTNTHPGFKSEFIPEVVDMILQFDGLKDIALACGASRLHALSGRTEMNEAGIIYYSRAMSEVHQALNSIDWSREVFSDAVLMAIIFLYVHGVFTIDTYKDIPRHLSGAIQLINLRCVECRHPPLARPIHRIVWESILYQVFRQTVRHPFAADFQPDFEFCAKAEEILQSLTFPDASEAENSPVIGFPLSLQKFIIEIVQLCKSPFRPQASILLELGREMRYWESTIPEKGHCIKKEGQNFTGSTPAERAQAFHQHSTSLHVLAASLLFNWVCESHEISGAEEVFSLPPPSNSWQVRRALEIMRCPQANKDWSRCYLGSWPTLIFGYAVDKPEDMALIRRDLEERFQVLYSGEELLFLSELESIWRTRGIYGSDY